MCMKRIFTSLFALVLCAVPALSQVIYSTDFASEEDFQQWTVFDVNEDGSTWEFDSGTDPYHLFYSYNSTNAADDWAISPAIVSEEDGTVAVSFTVKGSSYGEKLQLMYGDAPTVEAMTSAASEVLALSDDVTDHLYLLPVTAGKPLYLGFKACSDADKWRLYLCGVTVQFTTRPVDLTVTEIVAPESGFGLSQESVTVKVKNAGTVDVDAFDLVLSVDGNEVATEAVSQALAAGAEMEYTFQAKADLSTPRKQFNVQVCVVNADDINGNNNCCSKGVLHKAPATVPYYMGFESDEYTDGITLYNLNEDDGNWDLYSDPWWSMAHTGDYCLAYNYNKYNNADDWAVLEPITIEESGYYVLKFWYSGDDTHPEKLGVYYGNSADPAALTNKIVEYAPFARGVYEESINIIYLEKQENLYIGFYAFSDKDENWICVDDVSLEKISSETVDLAVTAISNPTEYVHEGSAKNVSFTLRSYGISDVDATVKVKIDETVLVEQTITVKAQEVKEMELSDALADVAAGEHVITVEIVNADDSDLDNNSKEFAFRVMGKPAKRWDFEDGQLPAEFVYRSEDGGTVHPNAGEEFNEEGWGIFSIQTHPLYGEYMLAATSWLEGTEKADRWCVLPPFNPTEESYLVWDVASFNPVFLETYSVMVSTNGDDSWYYFTEEEYIAESPDFKTRGLSLGEYAENAEIYIAFRLRSKNCENLILDNIELYGGDVATSVTNVVENAYNVTVNANAVEVEGPAVESVALYTASGALVARANENRLSVSGLAAGVYVVNVTTGGAVYNKTVVVK